MSFYVGAEQGGERNEKTQKIDRRSKANMRTDFNQRKLERPFRYRWRSGGTGWLRGLDHNGCAAIRRLLGSVSLPGVVLGINYWGRFNGKFLDQ